MGKPTPLLAHDFAVLCADLYLQAKEDIISMDNGCVCCTVRGDLVKAFMTLGRRKEKYDAVIIETTGARHVPLCVF